MATYIIGDLQGCYDDLMNLLDKIKYDPAKDELWFAGDIVNRGPKSLECLRFVKNLGDSGKMVLGNHDFHLLAAYAGLDKYRAKTDTLQPILKAKDADDLINWLRHQPLFVEHSKFPAVMVHAGIPPQWSIKQAKERAQEVEAVIQADDWKKSLKHHLFGSEPNEWDDKLKDWDRIRYILNALVRMRYCDKNGKLEFKSKMAPSGTILKSKYQPWFCFEERQNLDKQIFFGHWSTLGAIDAYEIHSTDTGCLWGGQLTAYCLDTNQRHTVNCPENCRK
ncbi:symmetrical bis(5'-nucleosyl)-tetraphosphatase [Hydrogenovibrio kuenenii]|uniref:symmetrical bis(5'-nucleosyl)-tetraphosphatase n=1 Tax=Hydrogenovibrio kuenenii TaxID=63658 RepID=UPI000464BFDF|nr:symmetrical bis(5'-nucleosyl)-tetraphosphatase [Hydrogenovibrio kuenenii]